MSGTQHNLPRITAEPEVWTADPDRWLRRRDWAAATLASLAIYAGFWWWTGDLLAAFLVMAAALICATVVPAVLWCWREIRELRRRTAVLSQQAVADRLDHWELASTVRNSRMDELTRRRAERQQVPAQRSEEGQ